ncbi:MAG: hypothetical protein AAFW65_06035 [Pseudomonadota bacterium]
MPSQGPVLETIRESYKFTGRNLLRALPYALAFAVAVAALAVTSTSAMSPGVWMIVVTLTALSAFVLGCILSAKLYGLALRTGPAFPSRDDVINLGFANGAVYAFFGIIAFFVGFFLVMLPGILVAQSGLLDPETVETDPEAVRSAFDAVMAGPAGVIVLLIALAGAAILGFLGLRLVVFAIATFARGEIRVLSTWDWTTGSLRKIAAISVATHVLPFILCAVVFSVVSPVAQFGPIGHGLTWFVTTMAALPFLMTGHAMATRVYLQIAPNLTETQQATARA